MASSTIDESVSSTKVQEDVIAEGEPYVVVFCSHFLLSTYSTALPHPQLAFYTFCLPDHCRWVYRSMLECRNFCRRILASFPVLLYRHSYCIASSSSHATNDTEPLLVTSEELQAASTLESVIPKHYLQQAAGQVASRFSQLFLAARECIADTSSELAANENVYNDAVLRHVSHLANERGRRIAELELQLRRADERVQWYEEPTW